MVAPAVRAACKIAWVAAETTHAWATAVPVEHVAEHAEAAPAEYLPEAHDVQAVAPAAA